MPRKKYYEVPLGGYLFERPESHEVIKPEERVRQWCVHELIRAYGYQITDITFEHPVKVGSKNYRIDILIKRDDKPFIVVECKKTRFKQHQRGLEQAISYANAERIKAEYAVYTNGSDWLVKRYINGRWAPVADISSQFNVETEYSVNELYIGLNDAAPLLHKLIDPLNDQESLQYLKAMDRFFISENLLTKSGDCDLRRAIDNILRSIIHFTSIENYMRAKFHFAYCCVAIYAGKIGMPWDFLPPHEEDHPFWQTALYQMELLEFLEDTRCEVVGIDFYLLELLAALFGYCHELRHESIKVRPTLPTEVQEAMRGLLNYGFRRELHYRVPMRSDRLTHQDIKYACSYGWDNSQDKSQ